MKKWRLVEFITFSKLGNTHLHMFMIDNYHEYRSDPWFSLRFQQRRGADKIIITVRHFVQSTRYSVTWKSRDRRTVKTANKNSKSPFGHCSQAPDCYGRRHSCRPSCVRILYSVYPQPSILRRKPISVNQCEIETSESVSVASIIFFWWLEQLFCGKSLCFPINGPREWFY